MEKVIELMEKLEGLKLKAYDCTANKRSIGYGFNMEQYSALSIWEELNIQEDFNKVFNREIEISKNSAEKLFYYFWEKCEEKAKKRCVELNLNYDNMPDYKRFILADIVYNTGSIKKWKKVLTNEDINDVLFEARRNPKQIMDSRVAKIGYHFGLLKNIEEAHSIGLEFAKYLK